MYVNNYIHRYISSIYVPFQLWDNTLLVSDSGVRQMMYSTRRRSEDYVFQHLPVYYTMGL